MTGASVTATGRRAYAQAAASSAERAGTAARAGRRGEQEGSGRVGRLIFGVPARFMGPRLIIYVCTFALVAFGILMIYSASSITAMFDEDLGYDASFYVVRQLRTAFFGLLAAVFIAVVDYRKLVQRLIIPIWIVTVGLLVLVFTAAIGQGAYGAMRWIKIGGFSLQPSEFAKVTVILTLASLLSRYLEDRSLSGRGFIASLPMAIGVPLVAIFLQPDKGTTVICALTLAVMAFVSGINRRFLSTALCVVAGIVLVFSIVDGYARDRILMAWNPWSDEWGAGYQLVQGQYAFSTGGLLGVGIGMSRQKYSYLPMAHNDFIFAIIGEELGLVGTLCVLAVFAALILAAFQVARHARDLMGRVIACGCASLIAIQLFVNIGGVLGIIPLSGKPVPFISYGGSSIISCLMLVGFVVSVSRHSTLPETVFDERRRGYAVTPPAVTPPAEPARALRPQGELSLVGEPTLRSERREGAAASTATASATASADVPASVPAPRPLRLTVLPGGRSGSKPAAPDPSDRSPEALRAARAFDESHGKGRVSVDASGRRRIDLGPDAASRLRKR